MTHCFIKFKKKTSTCLEFKHIYSKSANKSSLGENKYKKTQLEIGIMNTILDSVF